MRLISQLIPSHLHNFRKVELFTFQFSCFPPSAQQIQARFFSYFQLRSSITPPQHPCTPHQCSKLILHWDLAPSHFEVPSSGLPWRMICFPFLFAFPSICMHSRCDPIKQQEYWHVQSNSSSFQIKRRSRQWTSKHVKQAILPIPTLQSSKPRYRYRKGRMQARPRATNSTSNQDSPNTQL